MFKKALLIPVFFLHAVLHSFEAQYANGKLIQIHSIPIEEISSNNLIKEKSVYCDSIHFSYAWGHAIQDTVFPIFKFLKENDLLDTNVSIFIKSSNEEHIVNRNAQQFMKDIFPFVTIHVFNDQSPKTFFEDIEIIQAGAPLSECAEHMAFMRSFGFKDNITIPHKKLEENLVTEFVDYVLNKYDIKENTFIPNRVYLLRKDNSCARRIINMKQVIQTLKKHGYEVVDVDFTHLSPKEQIILTRSSEFFISTHGASLTNTIFLQPEAKVLIIWPENAKYFHNRKYCPFTSILLSKGNKIIEYDKPYHKKDRYLMKDNLLVPQYFYKHKNRVQLRKDKKNWTDILAFPLPCMLDIYQVNMFIGNPEQIISRMQE